MDLVNLCCRFTSRNTSSFQFLTPAINSVDLSIEDTRGLRKYFNPAKNVHFLRFSRCFPVIRITVADLISFSNQRLVRLLLISTSATVSNWYSNQSSGCLGELVFFYNLILVSVWNACIEIYSFCSRWRYKMLKMEIRCVVIWG